MYYAVYLEARTWCEQNRGYQRTQYSREHSDISRPILEVDAELADSLAFLRRLRNVADYDIGVSGETMMRQRADAGLMTAAVLDRLDSLVVADSAAESTDPGTDA